MSHSAIDVSKRDHIVGTLESLKAAMPDKTKMKVCDRFLEKLNYTAPELMDRRWAEIYEFLSTQVPGELQLQTIWNTASERYRELCAGQ